MKNQCRMGWVYKKKKNYMQAECTFHICLAGAILQGTSMAGLVSVNEWIINTKHRSKQSIDGYHSRSKNAKRSVKPLAH